jgi:hypothetical protein
MHVLFARALTAFALLGVLSGCAHELERTWARLKVETLVLPVVYKKQGVIISIDGHQFGSTYSSVRVPEGYHEVHAVFIDCPLPSLIVTCFNNALEETVPFEAKGGETYILRRSGGAAWIEPESRDEERIRLFAPQ